MVLSEEDQMRAETLRERLARRVRITTMGGHSQWLAANHAGMTASLPISRTLFFRHMPRFWHVPSFARNSWRIAHGYGLRRFRAFCRAFSLLDRRGLGRDHDWQRDRVSLPGQSDSKHGQQ